MKKVSFWRIFWASALGSLLVGIVVTILAGVTFSAILSGFIDEVFGTPKELKVEENTVLHMDLKTKIGDRSFARFDANTLSLIKQAGVYEMIEGLKIAEEDKNIKGILIETSNVDAGFATLKELRDALVDFKKSGKFIVAYSEMMSPKSYYLSTVADEMYAFPTGMIDWRGLGTEIMFLTGLLEKLEIEMQIIRGSNNKFKSAVEPLMLKEMSEANRLQTLKFLSSLWGEMVTTTAQSRDIPESEIENIASNVLLRTTQDAVDYKMIDGLKYKDEVIEILKNKAGTKKDEDLEMQNFTHYVNKKTKRERILNKDKKKNVAIIFAQGNIVSGDDPEGVISSERISKAIRDARLDDDIKAVVLRVNSPGGSALASDVIWREVVLTKKEKPIIVSMGDLAASGGYYIACAADKIYAQPNTITGSIGVFGIIPYTGKMFENKLGLTFDRVSTNEHAVFSLNKRLDTLEMRIIQEGVDDIYDDFITKVSEGRGISKEMVDSVGQGRVWSGRDAIEIGLVDELGGIEDAIAEAGKRASIDQKDIKIKMLPKPKNEELMEILENLENMDKNDDASVAQKGELMQILMDYHDQIQSLEIMQGYQMRMPYFFRFLD